MNDLLKKPFHKRWPGRYAFKFTMYDPHGGRLAMETDADNLIAQTLVKLFTLAACRIVASPRLVELMKEVAKECDDSHKRVNAIKAQTP